MSTPTGHTLAPKKKKWDSSAVPNGVEMSKLRDFGEKPKEPVDTLFEHFVAIQSRKANPVGGCCSATTVPLHSQADAIAKPSGLFPEGPTVGPPWSE